MKMSRATLSVAVSLAFGGTAFVGSAYAQSSAADLQRQIDSLQRQVDDMKKGEGRGSEPGAPSGRGGTPVTADTSIQLYGHLDLSVDTATKGMSEGHVRADGTTAVRGPRRHPGVAGNRSPQRVCG